MFRRASARWEAPEQGRGPSAAGGWPESSGLSVGGAQPAACYWPASLGSATEGQQRRAPRRRTAGQAVGDGPGVTSALGPSGQSCSGLWENNRTFEVLTPSPIK